MYRDPDFIQGNLLKVKVINLIYFVLIQGEIQRRGVLAPLTMDIYQPILSRLRSEGLHAVDEIKAS